MTNRAAIVLNGRTLSEICGANDQNLRALEDLLGVGIFSRGNELFLNTEDEGTWGVFKQTIRSLERRLKLGEEVSPDMVQAVYRSLGGDAGEAEAFKSLWTGHFVYQMAVNIQQHFAVTQFSDDVCIPNLVKQCFTHSEEHYIFSSVYIK